MSLPLSMKRHKPRHSNCIATRETHLATTCIYCAAATSDALDWNTGKAHEDISVQDFRNCVLWLVCRVDFLHGCCVTAIAQLCTTNEAWFLRGIGRKGEKGVFTTRSRSAQGFRREGVDASSRITARSNEAMPQSICSNDSLF